MSDDIRRKVRNSAMLDYPIVAQVKPLSKGAGGMRRLVKNLWHLNTLVTTSDFRRLAKNGEICACLPVQMGDSATWYDLAGGKARLMVGDRERERE
jgi:hypothetical protein